jgi:hypothetical protein
MAEESVLDSILCKELDEGETLGWICNACSKKNAVTRTTCEKCMTSVTYSNQLARAKLGSSLGASQGLVAVDQQVSRNYSAPTIVWFDA